MQGWESGELVDRAGREGPYVEFLRAPDVSAGVYRLAKGAEDPQQPHTEDEVYVVLTGRASFRAGGQRRDVTAGSVLYVPAGEPHRFEEIQEELSVLVIFAPAEYARRGEGGPGGDR